MPVHKVVVCSQSPVFEAAFSGAFKVSNILLDYSASITL